MEAYLLILVVNVTFGKREYLEGHINSEGVTNDQRPKYGALNLMLHPDGPAPRFGSCYFLLSPKVSSRSTYTYFRFASRSERKGTYQEFDMILAALLEETFVRDFAIGEGNLTPTILINHLLANLKGPFIDVVSKEPARNLNHYIEAQIHGEISLKEDVEALVADPSFKGTDVRKSFRRNLPEVCY